ncbi:KaiC domain protein, PAE1156 family [Caldisphaera lagunensis DSM 15908]|uniref:KaiC domain protein, PAE1156 family n=1 Tax=Caldisphaera lagunensis (strain DSM 15908 / JCM 11604 / ANMR 0165 / IC-154) TaxID=1056495 RepID=L0A8J0_CALLD|nr:KaiC domain-containing protein [Caldisphaera lagunensis]AFZ70183.1 KaiC domain protein, PAE1156 family [Caldisphaera lagunensis DSM 15908]
MSLVKIERLATGVKGFDKLISGGIPRGFFVAVVGEPGTGKTIFGIHYAWQGVKENDKIIYVTTEESRESIIRQAKMFGMNLDEAVDSNKMIIIDALMKNTNDEWTLNETDIDELVKKIIDAKKKLGYGRARLVIDSMSTFWLDKPAMARIYSYNIKRVLYKWDFTALLTSQYAITTSSAFGWGVEHVADGIIRFGRRIVGGELKRYVLVEKMRQTPHDLRVHYITIEDKIGMKIEEATELRQEDVSMPEKLKKQLKNHEGI